VKDLRLGRYLVEWCLLMLLGALVGELARETVGGTEAVGDFRASVLWALAVVGVADPVIYVTVARGLVVDPEKFMVNWGLSVLGKFAWIGVAGLSVNAAGAVTREVFLIGMAGSFVVLSTHQVFRLVRLADAERMQEAR